jgi:hypothetical protein
MHALSVCVVCLESLSQQVRYRTMQRMKQTRCCGITLLDWGLARAGAAAADVLALSSQR